jgi:diguanylate cyclase (GGDEF)-like protein
MQRKVKPKLLVVEESSQRRTYTLKELSNLYTKKDRAVKIIKEMSEFLRVLDLRESDILKTMIVRFAIESVEASQGSLIVYDSVENVLKYQDTYVYDVNNKIVLDISVFEGYSELLDIQVKAGEGIVGEAYLKGVPIIVESMEGSKYPKPPVGDIMKIDIGSVIAMPLKINNEVIAVLEITKASSKTSFTKDDLETIMIIANFASAILENAKLFLWAIHDSQTGLYNNHYLYKELFDEIEKSKRYGRIFSLVMIDIDNFKLINDSYGHISGDKALVHLSECIKKTIRKDVDIASRYGGDEFVIVFPNTSAEVAYKICDRLLTLASDQKIKTLDGREFSFTLSIGISEFPKDGEESYFLFNHMDDALYAAKKKGKNTICIYNKKMSKRQLCADTL